MAQIKNKLRQPLVINYETKSEEGKERKFESMHFLAKQTRKVPDELLADGEFKSHIEKGNLVVIRLG